MTAHLKGLQAFQERLELYGDDIAMWEINEALQAYLEASGMVMVPREVDDNILEKAFPAPVGAYERDAAMRCHVQAQRFRKQEYSELIKHIPSPFSQANTEGEKA